MTPGWLLASRAGIYVSAAMLAAALVEAYLGYFGVHAWPALTGGPTLFPASVWVSYAASAARAAAPSRGYLASSASTVVLIALGGAVGLSNPRAGAVLAGLRPCIRGCGGGLSGA